jgi:hypothetical protein
MEGFKYQFLPSADPSTHLGFNETPPLMAVVIEHMDQVRREAPGRIVLSMRDAEFGPDPEHRMRGVVILAHVGKKSRAELEGEARDGGIPVGFVVGLDTMEFVRHCPRHPDAWAMGYGDFTPYERPPGRLH